MKKIISLIVVFFAFNLGYVAISQSGASPVKIDRDRRDRWRAKDENSVLVLMRAKADLSPAYQMESKIEKGRFVYEALRKVALESQTDLIDFLRSKQIPFQRFYIANMIALPKVSYPVIAEIEKRADVEKIYENPEFIIPGPFSRRARFDTGSLQAATPQNNIERVRAPQVWNEWGVKGKGIVVAGQDSGIEWNHPALIRQYRGGEGRHDFNWHDAIRSAERAKPNPCGYATAVPCDDGGHGTHTMGTVLGSDGVNNWIGVAPAAQWIGCRNMDQGAGTPATYIDCFEFFLAPYANQADPLQEGRPELAPDIINNSWGCPLSEGCSGREMIPVLEALQAAGIFVVASAGNDGPDCSSIADQPAHLSGLAFSVGSVAENADKISFFSSRGPSLLTGQVVPDLTAPGENIRSAVPGHGYETGWSGTSMAGPHVAGVVALVWSAAPQYIGKVKETMELLRRTSQKLMGPQSCGGVPGSEVPNNTFGYGLIDSYAAVKAALATSYKPAQRSSR